MYEITWSGLSRVALTEKNGTGGLVDWLTDGSKTLYASQLFAWGIMKDVLWFLSKEKCTATHAENRLCEHKAILKRKILRIETPRTALQTLLVTITNIQYLS